jgi:leader peptidase (prepilin peptidase)/N-methyltransferase
MAPRGTHDTRRTEPEPVSPFGRPSTGAATVALTLVYLAAWLVLGRPYWASPIDLSISLALAATLIALSVIDLQSFRLPDLGTLPLIAAGLGLAWLLGWDNLWWRIAAAAAGYLALLGFETLYRLLRGRAGLGMGDAKLLAAAGAWLGLEALPLVLLAACALATLAVLALVVAGNRLGLGTRIPFGPFLALGLWIVWLTRPLG